MINFELQDELNPSLSPGEKLLWTGKPRRGLVLRSSDIYLIPFSLLWGGFAFFWETMVIKSNGPLLFRVWGIPFVLIGIYMIIGRFFVDAWKRSNTVYGITADRIIIRSGLVGRTVKSLNIRTISDITLTQKRDGSGTISLGPSETRNNMMQGMEWPGAKQPPRLELIDDVKEVYDKIIALQRQV